MILTPLEAVVGIGMNAISRKFEYEADRFACELQEKLETEDAKDLSDRLGKALIAIHVKNLSTVWVDWLSVSFFSCLSCLSMGDLCLGYRYSAYHHSHPTLLERLRALDVYKAQRSAKIKKAN